MSEIQIDYSSIGAGSLSAARIAYDPEKHDILTTQLKEIETAFIQVLNTLEKTKNDVDGALEGEAAEQLAQTFHKIISDFKREKDNWETVIDNTMRIEQELISLDHSLSQFVQKADH